MLHKAKDVQKESLDLKLFLTVREAALFLGVHSDTLRRWEKAGKLKAIRHPLNNYRLYTKEALEKLVQSFCAS